MAKVTLAVNNTLRCVLLTHTVRKIGKWKVCTNNTQHMNWTYFFKLSILVYECWDSQLSTLLLLPNKHQPHSQAFLGRPHGKEAKYTADEPSKDVVTASPYTIREQRTLSLDTITPTARSSVFICQCLLE